jgi:D-alanyl-lipoteichoic acid acyltransferase DltB (MBOAT superfamily)
MKGKGEKMLSMLLSQIAQAGLIGIAFLILLIPVVWFIVAILLCIWVYRDAKSRGMNGALWLIIVLIAGIIGLIIYIVVREEKKQPATQPPVPP